MSNENKSNNYGFMVIGIVIVLFITLMEFIILLMDYSYS